MNEIDAGNLESVRKQSGSKVIVCTGRNNLHTRKMLRKRVGRRKKVNGKEKG